MGKLDGQDGPKTQTALLNYKKSRGLERFNSKVELNDKVHKIELQNSDDFVRYTEEYNDACNFEFCCPIKEK